MADAITKNVGKVWWTAANRPWELHCEPFKLAPHMYYTDRYRGRALADRYRDLRVHL